jgi:hypothetical protein
MHYSVSKHHTEKGAPNKETMFVIVDATALSNPSSKELLANDSVDDQKMTLKKYFHDYIKPAGLPSSSKEVSIPPNNLKISESKEEVQMMDINLQSENDIPLLDNDSDKDSIVMAYLRNRNTLLELEGTLLSNKKKSSLLQTVPKMETILEGEQFSAFTSAPRNLPTTQESSREKYEADN